MDREQGGRSVGWRRLGREAEVLSWSLSRGFLPGTPLGERLPGLGGSQLLPSALAALTGERLPGVRYEPHRKPDIRTALGGGPRGEARAPAPPIAVLFLVFCKEEGVGWSRGFRIQLGGRVGRGVRRALHRSGSGRAGSRKWEATARLENAGPFSRG